MAENHTTKEAVKEIQGSARRKTTMFAAVFIIVGGLAGLAYWNVSSKIVYIDQSVISAPLINLAPQTSGVLRNVFVKEGDEVGANMPVAQVGDEVIKSSVAGEIVSVNNNIGAIVNPGETVVAMINRDDLRVVGHLEENKGLADVSVGNTAKFTVDAFGSKEFYGIVDEVSPTSRSSDVVFDISSQRPTNEFDVKIAFDPQKYPELSNGMSARIWVFK